MFQTHRDKYGQVIAQLLLVQQAQILGHTLPTGGLLPGGTYQKGIRRGIQSGGQAHDNLDAGDGHCPFDVGQVLFTDIGPLCHLHLCEFQMLSAMGNALSDQMVVKLHIRPPPWLNRVYHIGSTPIFRMAYKFIIKLDIIKH